MARVFCPSLRGIYVFRYRRLPPSRVRILRRTAALHCRNRGRSAGLKEWRPAYRIIHQGLPLTMAGEGNLPLNAIRSHAAFVVFSPLRLISEHEDHSGASQGLAEALVNGHEDAVIYRREIDWVVH